jgi:hypothetical protein
MHGKSSAAVSGGELQTLLVRPSQTSSRHATALQPQLLRSCEAEAREVVVSMDGGGRLEQRAAAGGDDPDAAATAASEGAAQMECWACSTLVQVPVVDGQLAPDFKVRIRVSGTSSYFLYCCKQLE